MALTSFIFLFFFLPLSLAAHLLTPGKYRNLSLLLMGLIMYEWGEGKYVTVLFVCAAVNFFLAACIEHCNKQQAAARGIGSLLLILSISANLGALVFFKYVGFITNSLSEIIEPARWLPLAPHVPLGLSFLTFRALSYTIDVYRGNVKAEKRPLRFLTYITLFPLMVAGPIVRYRDIANQLVIREVSVNKFARGVKRFAIGLGKKVLVANSVGTIADQIFAVPTTDLSICVAWFGAIAYTLQIYFDFSGYSDMAIGIGSMLGFEFPENFNYPYVSQSVREFWRRWHITLSTWFRDYLYIPLGGNKVNQYRNYANLGAVFLLCGLWHGADWTFISWGLWHGTFLMMERTRFKKLLGLIGRPGAHIYTLLVVIVGWVFFRSENVSRALQYLMAMLGFAPHGTGSVMDYLNVKVAVILIAGIIGSSPVAQTVSKIQACHKAAWFASAGTVGRLIISLDVAYVFFIMCLSIVFLAGSTYNPFIYARF
jgi:alginate O-acetyltransferase complex protein AlgI